MNAPATRVFRLRDILTKEVSLVDQAANKWRFLLTKRKDEEGKPLDPPADGGNKPASDTTLKAADKPADAPAQLVMKASTYDAIVQTAERLVALAKRAVTKADLVPDDEAVDKALTEALGGVVIERKVEVSPLWVDGVWKCDRKTLLKGVKNATQKLKEVADSLAVDAEDDVPPAELRWRIMDVLDNLVEFTRFEVAQRAMEKSGDAVYKQLAEGIRQALDSALSEDAAVSKVVSTQEELAKRAVETIAELRKKVRAQQLVIDKYESAPRDSQRLSVEDAPTRSAQKDVSWPLDMNAKRYAAEEDLNFA